MGANPDQVGIHPIEQGGFTMDAAQVAVTADAEFDLDVRIVESGDVVTALLRNTDDNCTQSKASACVTCFDD